jgi:hypothetical protein
MVFTSTQKGIEYGTACYWIMATGVQIIFSTNCNQFYDILCRCWAADQQPSKISAVVGRKNQCEREFECAKSYQYWPKEQVYESGGGGILFVPTES